jgi:halocyanin-like protein
MSDSDPTVTSRIGRRRYLGTGAAAVSALLAGCSGGGGGDGGDGGDTSLPTASVDSAAKEAVDGWLSDVGNYDGTVFEYAADSPAVAVGAQGNGGNYAYEPAAIAVSPGTTVTWEWTGRGQQHNVVENDGGYESELTTEEGFTYEYTFDSTGTSLYLCTPHRGLGMKGAVVVQE